jgi:hypothetical protein
MKPLPTDKLRKLIDKTTQTLLATEIANIVIRDQLTLSGLKSLTDVIGYAVGNSRRVNVTAALSEAEKIADAAGVPYMTDRDYKAIDRAVQALDVAE